MTRIELATRAVDAAEKAWFASGEEGTTYPGYEMRRQRFIARHVVAVLELAAFGWEAPFDEAQWFKRSGEPADRFQRVEGLPTSPPAPVEPAAET